MGPPSLTLMLADITFAVFRHGRGPRIGAGGARMLAERIMKEDGADIRTRLSSAFRLSTSRLPSPAELSILHAEFKNRLEEFEANPGATTAYLNGGGARKPDPALDQAELAAFAALCSLILNLDESISKS